jgi:exodeoxyribonuclease V gamma subunit
VLHVHRAASGNELVRALGEVLADPLPDVFGTDVVAVPAKGVERWLSQRLAHRLGADGTQDGVCARIAFPSPAAVLDEALAAVSPEHAKATEVWAPETAVWPLLDVLDALPREDVFGPVHHYLDGGPSRRYALAAKIARLFDAYGRDRPELIRMWQGVPADLSWQPEIWHRLRERLGPSPAELHPQAVEMLRHTRGEGRLSLYGVTRLTRTRLDVLAALCEQQDVHLFVHHPGAALWDRGAISPLLTSLSRDVRNFQDRLQAAVPNLWSHVHDGPTSDVDLLHRLQRDLRSDTVPAGTVKVDPMDRSVQVHACHGPARQVEVLREVLLRLLSDDAKLEPRDVLVMCPDVERYAPLVKAVFDTDSHPGGRLRVSIADRSPVQTNPLLGLATRLLEIAGSRVTGAQVLDVAGLPAVRRQFGLSDDDLEQLRGWTVAAHVHWGLDGSAREPWGLHGLEHGTWRTGMDRLLAGVALGGADTPYGGVLPVGGIDSTDIDLVGRFAELLDRLQTALLDLRGPKQVGKWMTSLEGAVLQLGDVAWDGAWQTAQLGRELSEVATAAGDTTGELTLTDVRVLLEQRLAGRPTRSSFRTGALTFCTMTPMRSVPHRAICLLGLDDSAFPRHGLPDGDDLLGRDPRPGERDPRSEDRQLFLDAILAAQDHLIITYSGADLRSGVRLPPAVPVGELLDALGSDREHVVTRHPLQPFDPANFTAENPFSFDASAFAGAKALRDPRAEREPFLPDPLLAVVPGVVTLRELKDFWEHPVKAFLRQRLEVTSSKRDDEPLDAITLELDNLQQWAVGDRVLRARMSGQSADAAGAAEQARGELPPGELGDGPLRRINDQVDALAKAARPWWGEQSSIDVDLRLPPDWTVSGSVALRGGVVLQIGYSTLGVKQRLRAWIDMLAATAMTGRQLQAVVVGRKRDDAVVERYGPVTPDRARELLEELVALRAVGLCTPLAVPVEPAAAYAEARKQGSGSDIARDAATVKWEGTFNYPGPIADAEHVLVWGEQTPFRELWNWACPVPLPAGFGGEPSNFAALACRVWNPLLDAEATP